MRLHRLDITAFGPFAGTEHVDFDELSAAGLFLLHGPTGAGKTSVLDAVCFALYGQVPGARPATRLRSDHAAPGTSTEVVLDLTVAGRRLEITRRPEQPRAKKRGSGFTLDKAVTQLREHSGGRWRALSKSHQETGEEIKQLLGMSCEQFCQVVLLPQGEFATFLRASATERTGLLGRLFDTRRFKDVEHELRDRRLDAAQRLAQGDRDLTHLAERMRQESGGAEPAAGAEDETADAAGLLRWAAVLRVAARERYDNAHIAVTHAEAAHAEAAKAAEAARDLDALQRRHAEARARATALDARRPARAAARARLDRAHRAATVDPALTLRDKAAARYRDAVAVEGEVTRELLAAAPDMAAPDLVAPAQADAPRSAPAPAAAAAAVRGDHAGAGYAGEGHTGSAHRDVPGPPGVGTAAPAEPAAVADRPRAHPEDPGTSAAAGSVPHARAAGLPAGRAEPAPDTRSGPGPAFTALAALDAEEPARRAGALREELGGLAAAGDVEARVREIAGRRAGLDREERADEEAVRDAQSWLEEWPATRARLQARADTAAEAAAQAAGLSGELETARRREEAAAERDGLATGLRRAEDTARDARDRAADARQTWQDLREARIAGIAAELAESLVEGEPCRVCGAADHPAPARAAGARVTRADEEAAAAGHQRESAAHDQARDRVTALRAALDAATAVAGDTPRAELAAAHAALAAEHTAAGRVAAGLSEARRALALAEEERDRRTAQRHAAQSRTAARTSRREELDEQYARAGAEAAAARAGHPSVEARRRALTARITLLDRAAHAVRDRADSAARLAEAQAALVRAAERAGFATEGEAVESLLPQGALWAAERLEREWAREEDAVGAALAESGPAAAAALPPARPAAAQAVLEAATDRLRALSAAEDAAARRGAELDRLGALATAQVRRLAPERAEFARIKRLSDLASATTAENTYKMELETYVLAARLEQVAAAAGIRLQRMSAGRYTLAHTDARGGGRAKSGLGLMVVDAWTGTERDTSTLSGGETFFASLALALGLADVVTDEAGGTRLDTLFIDEGFGSLDDQTLDEVLDVLDGLRERDRAVGIVSHVADLRHRIPAQLRVVKGRDGSSVRLRTGTSTGAGLRG